MYAESDYFFYTFAHFKRRPKGSASLNLLW